MRKFDDREREMIDRKLREHGRRLFGTLGLKKTNVADLTKAAGIASGSFYLFYGSKEELYYAILQEEEQALRTELGGMLDGPERVDRAGFKRFLLASARVFEERPLLRQLHDPGVLETLFRKLPEDRIEAGFADDAADLRPVIERGQREGWMAPRDPEEIVSLIRAFVLLALQRQQIGEARFDGTMELFAECIAAGLITE